MHVLRNKICHCRKIITREISSYNIMYIYIYPYTQIHIYFKNDRFSPRIVFFFFFYVFGFAMTAVFMLWNSITHTYTHSYDIHTLCVRVCVCVDESGYKPPWDICIYKHNVRVKDAVMSSAGVRLAEKSAWGDAHAYSAVQVSSSARRTEEKDRGVGSFFCRLSLHLEGHILTTPKYGFLLSLGRVSGRRSAQSFESSQNQRLRPNIRI